MTDRNRTYSQLAEYIERTLAEAPPLTDEQLGMLTVLLNSRRSATTSTSDDGTAEAPGSVGVL